MERGYVMNRATTIGCHSINSTYYDVALIISHTIFLVIKYLVPKNYDYTSLQFELCAIVSYCFCKALYYQIRRVIRPTSLNNMTKFRSYHFLT